VKIKSLLALVIAISCNSGQDSSEVQSSGGGSGVSSEPASQFLVDFPIPLQEKMSLIAVAELHPNVKNIPVCADVEVSLFRDSDVNFPSLINPPSGRNKTTSTFILKQAYDFGEGKANYDIDNFTPIPKRISLLRPQFFGNTDRFSVHKL